MSNGILFTLSSSVPFRMILDFSHFFSKCINKNEKMLVVGSYSNGFYLLRNVSVSIFFIHRFGSSAYRSNQWRYRGRTDAIQFCVDKRVFIVGFGLYGSSNGSSDYSAKIELKTLSGRILASNVQQFFSDGSSNTFQVILNATYKVYYSI